MLKTYLRTLVKSIRYVITFLAVMFLGGGVLYFVANLFAKFPGIPSLIVLGTPTAVTFIVSIITRKGYIDVEYIYKKSSDALKWSVGKDLKRTFCTKEFWVELLVFCHYMAVLCIVGGRIIFSDVTEGILIVIGCVVLFIVLNMTSWLLVHRTYLKNKSVS